VEEVRVQSLLFASIGRGCACIGKGCLHQGSLNGQLCDPLLSTHHPTPLPKPQVIRMLYGHVDKALKGLYFLRANQ